MPDPLNAVKAKISEVGSELGGDGALSVEFELDQGWSDGYTNRFEPPQSTEFGTHERILQWKGGKFDGISISVNLVVGIQTGLDDPEDLRELVTRLFRLSLAKQLKTLDKPLRLEIGTGSWFVAIGFIENLRVVWKDPYDVQTGYPGRAEVHFIFRRDFQAGQVAINEKLYPYRDDFTFFFEPSLNGGAGGLGGNIAPLG